MNQLHSDLRNVFGFSYDNAVKAEQLWRAGKLPAEYASLMNNLFYNAWNRMNPKDMRMTADNMWNRFNYLLTTGEL